MPNVKRTFSLPPEISAQLDQTIPHKHRSRFIAVSLEAALHDRKRQAFIDFLGRIRKKDNPKGLHSENVLRTIRAERVDDIIKYS